MVLTMVLEIMQFVRFCSWFRCSLVHCSEWY